MNFTVSASQIGTHQSCTYRWYLSYKLGLTRKAGVQSKADLGSAVHAGLAEALRRMFEYQATGKPIKQDTLVYAAYSGVIEWGKQNSPKDGVINLVSDGMVTIVPFDEEAWKTLLNDAFSIAQHAIIELRLATDYQVMGHNGKPLVEYTLTKDFYDDDNISNMHHISGYKGVVDAVLKHKPTGIVQVIDWKVRSKFSDYAIEDLSTQLPLYAYMLLDLGIEVQQVMIYQIRAQAPKVPKTNKDGSLSRAYVATTWEVYNATLLGAGLDPADYIEEMKPKLEAYEWFRPVAITYNRAMLEVFWNNAHVQALAIEVTNNQATVYGAESLPRAYGFNCKFCQFKDICHSEIRGYDTDTLVTDLYEKRKDNEDNEVITDDAD